MVGQYSPCSALQNPVMCHIVATFREPTFFPFRKVGRAGILARIIVCSAISLAFIVGRYLDRGFIPTSSQRLGVFLAVLFLMLILDIPNVKRYVLVRTDGLSTVSPFFWRISLFALETRPVRLAMCDGDLSNPTDSENEIRSPPHRAKVQQSNRRWHSGNRLPTLDRYADIFGFGFRSRGDQ